MPSYYARQPFSVVMPFVLVHLITVLTMAAGAAWVADRWSSPTLVFVAAALVGLGPGLLAVVQVGRRVRRVLHALIDGLHSLKEQDYNVRLATGRRDEFDSLAILFNALSASLREVHNDTYQKELLQDAVFQRSPNALVLTDSDDRILFSNAKARRLLHGGIRMEGHRLGDLLSEAPDALLEALEVGLDTLLTVPLDAQGEPETFHISRRDFTLNGRPHGLTLIAPLTREIAREESRIWKKTIRVLAHEVNNSLAPISSLLHSAKVILKNPAKHAHRLGSILDTINERAAHLRTFIDGYARYARLPDPRREAFDWGPWIEQLRDLYLFQLEGALPDQPGFADPGQLEQVLINLLKNAREAGGDPEAIALRISAVSTGATYIQVMDRGCGMSEEAMNKALLPFYSTKKDGTGLGLPLCREIIEAHQGTMSIERRSGGGTIVTCMLPAAPPLLGGTPPSTPK